LATGIDPGHGGSDPGGLGPTGLKEKDVNLSVSLLVIELLKAHGMDVVATRTTDIYLSLKERSDMLNNEKVDLVVSIHVNRVADPAANYVANFIIARGGQAEKAAKIIQEELRAATGWPGPASKDGVIVSNLHMVRETKAPAVIVEMGFISNPEQEKQLKNQEFHKVLATAIARGIVKYFGLQWKTQGTTILGPATATIAQAQEWARQNRAPQEFLDLAPLYWKIAPERAGVDPAVAYVQFAHETGFLYRDGKSMAGIDASYHNPCGLKVTQGGGNTDPNAHKKFVSWEEGITAHIDHLAIYAGAPGYPRQDTPDPRHFPYIAGKAPTVEELGGKWAPSPAYGEKLVSMLKALQMTPILEIPIEKPKTILIVKSGEKEVIKAEISGAMTYRDNEIIIEI
jgi:hypothetical protein